MQIKIKPLALENDLAGLSGEKRTMIFEKVEELKDQPTDHTDCGPIHNDDNEFEAFKLKITEGDLHHRALYDIVEGDIVVYGFMERPPEEYDEETLEEKVGKRE